MYNFGYTGDDIHERIELIQLCARYYLAYSKKHTGTIYDMLLSFDSKIKKDDLRNLAEIIEALTYGCVKFDSYDCKTTGEASAKIKEILSKWVPF